MALKDYRSPDIKLMAPMGTMRAVGGRIKELRLALNISQSELAERAGIGTRTLTRLESGEPVGMDAFFHVLEGLDTLPPASRMVREPPVRDLKKYVMNGSRKKASGRRRQ